MQETTPEENENTEEEEDVVPSNDDRGEEVEINSVDKEGGTPKENVDEISSDQLIKANKKTYENDVQEVE